MNDLELLPRRNAYPGYNFSSYVVSDFNRSAYTALQSLMKSAEDGKVPAGITWFYGGSGTGKTHLLWAAKTALEDKNHIEVCYVTAQEMFKSLLYMLRREDYAGYALLKEYYADADILIVDDAQWISDNSYFYDAFKDIFVKLLSDGGHLLVATLGCPEELSELAEYIGYTAATGCACCIGPLGFEDARMVLNRKLAESSTEWSEEVKDYLLQKIDGNLFRIDGILKRLIFVAGLQGREVALELAMKETGCL